MDPGEELGRLTNIISQHAQQSSDDFIQGIDGLLNDLDSSKNPVKRLELWMRGEPPPAPGLNYLYREYLQQLWKLMDRLRVQKRYEEALQVWCYLRTMTEVTNPAAISLALELAPELQNRHELLNYPRPARWVFLLFLEALHLTEPSGTQEPVPLEKVFKTLRIDWRRPERLDRINYFSTLINDLDGVLSDETVKHRFEALSRGFSFSKAMAEWRLGQPPNYERLKETFDILITQDPDNNVYRWCKLRVLYEAADGNPLDAITNDYNRWRSQVNFALPSSPESFILFFQALMEAERVLQRRMHLAHVPDRPPSVQQLRELLSNPPEIVNFDSALRDHITCIREKFIEKPKPPPPAAEPKS